MSLSVFDWLFIASGVIFFLSIIGVFITIKKERIDLTKKIGLVMLPLIIPLFFVLINYILIAQDFEMILSIILILAYLIVELLLDFVFKIDFRTKPSRHVPYILLEYVACFSFIINSFKLDAILGWLMSILFWMMMAALIYLYSGKKEKIEKTKT